VRYERHVCRLCDVMGDLFHVRIPIVRSLPFRFVQASDVGSGREKSGGFALG
jgi:hypothetical protein